MNDLLPYIVLGVIALIVIYSVMRAKRIPPYNDNRDFRGEGTERPRYDTPEIRGNGTFGRDKHDDKDTPAWLRQSTRPLPDTSPESGNAIQGRGGFGKDQQ